MNDIVFIYVIGREAGPVKVGISKDPARRLQDLQPGCPFLLQVLYKVPTKNFRHAFKHERIFHDVYAEKRLCGEWFDLDAELAIECVDTGFEYEEYFKERDHG